MRFSFALFIARLLATGWSTYALWHTMNIHDRLQHLIGDPGTPCHLDVYGSYFAKRLSLQVCLASLYLTAVLNLLPRLRILSCTGMLSSFLPTSPGACTRYSFISLTTRRHLVYSPMLEIPHPYFHARWPAKRYLADVCSTALSDLHSSGTC